MSIHFEIKLDYHCNPAHIRVHLLGAAKVFKHNMRDLKLSFKELGAKWVRKIVKTLTSPLYQNKRAFNPNPTLLKIKRDADNKRKSHKNTITLIE